MDIKKDNTKAAKADIITAEDRMTDDVEVLKHTEENKSVGYGQVEVILTHLYRI